MDNENMTTAEVLDAISHERARLLDAIDAIGPRAELVPVTEEGWTAKDVLAHLIHWATQIAFGLGGEVQPPTYMQEERRRRQSAGLSKDGLDETLELGLHLVERVCHYTLSRRTLGACWFR